MSRPLEKRRVNFICSASYQLLPSGENQVDKSSLYSGKGRSDWATVALQGYDAYGTLKPAAAAAVEQIEEVSRLRVAGFVRSRPSDCSLAGEMALIRISPRASS